MKTQEILFAVSVFAGSVSATNAEGIEATSEGALIDLAAQALSEEARLDGDLVRVEGTPGKRATLHLFDIDSPGIDSDAYAITGEIRYESVAGDGFLEMWNHLPAEKGGKEVAMSFFSRTMDVSGPLGKLTGGSDWRAFQLPAYINDGSGRRPLKLTLNVVLPGEGMVELRNLKLQTIPTPKTPGTGGKNWILPGLSALFGAALVGLAWFLKKRKADSELRRIRALDS